MAHLRPHTQDHVLDSHNMDHNVFGVAFSNVNPVPMRDTRITCNNNILVLGGITEGDDSAKGRMLPAVFKASQGAEEEDEVQVEGRAGQGVVPAVAAMFVIMAGVILLARAKHH